MPETFDAAVYTDCVVGQGLDGIAGMQFQARTPGMTADLRAVVKRHLLYEPPEHLMEEARSVAEFPLSLAHVRENDVFATASGLYKGREVKGSRGGNHLTHAIATREPATYGPVRPAQLARAAFWATEPFPTTEADPPPEDWQPGPITPQAAASFVMARPDGPAMLAALVSVLADPRLAGRRRVAIVSEDADAALHWLAAATLLLPQRRALDIGFKVFSMEPAKSTLPVVVVHPRWSTFAASVDHDQGYALFDLTSVRWSRTPVDPEARAWADLFCTADPDAVVEAVDLADASGLRGAPARAMSTAATLELVPEPTVMPALLGWLRGQGPQEVRETYGALIIQALAAASDVESLRRLAEVAALPDYRPQRNTVLKALLRAEVRDAVTLPDRVLSDGQGRWTVPDSLRTAAQQTVVAALRTARPPVFAAVLTLASARGIQVSLDAVEDAASAFVAGWLDHPGARYQPAEWRTEPSMLVRLEQAISARAASGSTAKVLATTWWRILRPAPFVADLGSPLDAALLSAAMRDGSEQHRLTLVRENFRAAGSRYRAGNAAALRDLAGVLWNEDTRPTLQELQAAADFTDGQVLLEPAALPDLVSRSLDPEPLSLSALAACRAVLRAGLFDPGDAVVQDVTGQVQALESADRRVRDMLRQTFDAEHPSPAAVENDIRLVRTHARTFVERLHAVEDLPRLQELLRVLPPDLVDSFLRRCAEDASMTTWSAPRAAVVFYLLHTYHPKLSHATQVLHDACGRRLHDWTATRLESDLHAVLTCLEPLDGSPGQAWQRHADALSKPPGVLSRLIERLRNAGK